MNGTGNAVLPHSGLPLYEGAKWCGFTTLWINLTLIWRGQVVQFYHTLDCLYMKRTSSTAVLPYSGLALHLMDKHCNLTTFRITIIWRDKLYIVLPHSGLPLNDRDNKFYLTLNNHYMKKTCNVVLSHSWITIVWRGQAM